MIQNPHSSDPTIDDIHRIRQQTFDKFGGDIAAILADARERQAASGRPVWRGASAVEKRQSPRESAQAD